MGKAQASGVGSWGLQGCGAGPAGREEAGSLLCSVLPAEIPAPPTLPRGPTPCALGSSCAQRDPLLSRVLQIQ